MAFTVTNLATDKDEGFTETKSIVGVTAAIGDLIVVMASAGNSGTGGAASTPTCTDPQGNTYTLRSQVNQDPGAADEGITLNIFTAVLTTALSTESITVEWLSPNVNGAVVGGYKFAPGAGETASYVTAGAGASGSSATPTITSGSITSGDVIVGAIAAETDDTITGDADTFDGSWSTQYGDQVGTLDATATQLRSQYKTVTADATQTYNPTIAGAQDYAINYIVIRSAGVLGASTGPGIVIGGSSSFIGEGAIGAPEGVGAQNLTPALFTDSDTFYTPTVTPGAVALTPSLYSDADTFYAASVSSLYTLTPALFADADTFYSPTVAAGAVNLSPALYTDADTFHAPTVTAGAVDLTPSLFVDADTLHSPTVSTGADTQDLTPGIYADGDTFHSATVSATYSLLPSLYSDADTFYAPTVTAAYGLTPALFADADTFYSPVVVGEGGEQFILPPYYDDPDTFHAAQVAQAQTITQAIHFDDPDEFHAAAVFRLGHGGVTRFRPLAYG